jgi:hypothetical protein
MRPTEVAGGVGEVRGMWDARSESRDAVFGVRVNFQLGLLNLFRLKNSTAQFKTSRNPNSPFFVLFVTFCSQSVNPASRIIPRKYYVS